MCRMCELLLLLLSIDSRYVLIFFFQEIRVTPSKNRLFNWKIYKNKNPLEYPIVRIKFNFSFCQKKNINAQSTIDKELTKKKSNVNSNFYRKSVEKKQSLSIFMNSVNNNWNPLNEMRKKSSVIYTKQKKNKKLRNREKKKRNATQFLGKK